MEQTQTEYVFRNAGKEDADAVLGLYRSSVGTPFCVWGEDYPGMLEIENDLATGNLFVMEWGGEIVGAVSIVPENELDGLECWTLTERAGEFARVVIRPTDRGRGLSGILVSNVLRVMQERGFSGVHISVAKQNLPARKTYLGLGFRCVGEAEMWDRSFDLYELDFSMNERSERSESAEKKRKELSEMTLEELRELFPIFLVAPRVGWKDDYREIEAVLKKLLPDRFAPRISHIGSTAIGGIWAKNIVDVLVEIPASENIDGAAEMMKQNGFITMSTGKNRISLNRGFMNITPFTHRTQSAP